MEASWCSDANLDAEPAPKTRAAEVIAEHSPYVTRTLRYLGVHEADLSDLGQEVFLVVLRRIGDFEGRASLRTWLYRICLRKTQHYRRNRARSARRRVRVPLQGGVASPHDALERGEKLATALRILDRLDADKREVFVLYEIEQLPMR
ncbi:MAG: sigma-70 family RNA polymerase sigma factor, partial [Myxococcota bacterium]